MDVKQVILIRTDLKDSKGNKVPCGKLMAQVAHASLTAITNLMYVCTEGKQDVPECYAVFRELNTYSNSPLHHWLTGEQKKVCLSVDSEDELSTLYHKALSLNLPCSYIIDNGHTVFNGVKTPTTVAIGPACSETIDSITKHLKLYK